MALELGCSQLEDPLRGSSLFSLLPITLGTSAIVASEAEELDSVDNLFQSVAMNALKGSKQLVQQAQTITKSYADINRLYHDDGPRVANGNDQRKEQRPGPGRKRARFSLKPPPSTSLPTVDYSSIDHIDDPDEYFSTFEQLECADKELKKLRGEVSRDLQHYQLTASHKRRPGRLGRTTSYKHRFSFNADAAESETFVESQEEPFDRRVLMLPKASFGTEQLDVLHLEPFDESDILQAKDTINKLQDTTTEEGPLSPREKRVANLLETAENLMREGLRSKSIAGKMGLPELNNICTNQHSLSKFTYRELKGAEISPTKLRSPLEGISVHQRRHSQNNRLKDIFSVFPSDDAPSSRDSSPCKNMDNVSISPVNFSRTSKIASTSNDASCSVLERGTTLCFEGQICSAVAEAGTSSGNRMISEEELVKDSSHLQANTNPDSAGVLNGKDDINDGFDAGLQEKGNDIQVDPAISDLPDLGFDDQTKKTIEQPPQMLGTYTNCDTCALNEKKLSDGFDGDIELEDNLIATQPYVGVEGATSSCADQSARGSLGRRPGRIMGESYRRSGRNVEISDSNDNSQSEENAAIQEKIVDTNAPMDISCAPGATISEDQNLENAHSLPEDSEERQAASEALLNEERKKKAPPRARNKKKLRQSLADISCSAAAAIPEDRKLENRLHPLSEEDNEGHQTALGAARNEGRKKKATPQKHKKKKYASRQSLAGAGMIWEDGRRRSSRRRVRPLEHWRGERLLYGRVHDSLATVIGVKYASPGKGSLKVESYVSEEYSDLVSAAAGC